MKPKFLMCIKQHHSPASNPLTKAEAINIRKRTNTKTEQLDAAVTWCIQNGSCGYAALKTGKFPLIKDCELINKLLDGKIVTGEERSYCTILTSNKEKSIVHFVKNKNRCMQPMSKKDLEKLILDVLHIHDYTNKKLKGSTKFQKLSRNVRAALEKGRQVQLLYLCSWFKTNLVSKACEEKLVNKSLCSNGQLPFDF